MTELETRYGKQIPEEKLRARSYSLEDSQTAEPLVYVVSSFDEEQRDKLKPEHTHHNGREDASRKALYHKQHMAAFRKVATARTGSHASTSWRRCWIRRTFLRGTVGLPESMMKKNAANFVINMACGSLSHITEKARVVTAWKQANVMSEIKLQTDVAARAHGQPVTMLPCDWTSRMTGVQVAPRQTNSK